MRTKNISKRTLMLGAGIAGLTLACWLFIKPILSFFSLIGIFLMAILYFSLSDIYFDVSKKPEYAYLTKPIFETEIDLFLFQWSDSKNYALGAPGAMFLPSSILAYKNDPESWMFSDDFAEKRQQPGYFHAEKVLGIIPKGTQLKIIKIRKNWFTGNVRGYFAHLENDQFAKYLANISLFLEPCTLDKVPELRKGYLKQVSQNE